MKKLIILVVSFCSVVASFYSFAQTKDKEGEKINTKCFVSLYGGAQTILYQIINENDFSNLANRLTNTSTMTTLSENKQQVYKVIECVKKSDKFKNKFALAIEKVTPK